MLSGQLIDQRLKSRGMNDSKRDVEKKDYIVENPHENTEIIHQHH